MRFNGLKSHLRLQKLRFLDAPGLFLLEIVLTGAYDLADVLANVLVLKWMIGALMGRDLIRAAWVLGGFLVYQLSVSFLWHWYFERVYPQWKERLEYKLNRRLYRIMLDADCRKYNDEGYFHGYRRALQFTQTKMEETLEFYRQLFGSFLAGAVAVVIYIRMDQMIVVFVLLAFVASRFCVKSLVEKTNAKRDEQNKKDALHQNYLRIFLRKEYAAEGRILGCLPFFVKRDQDSFSQKAEQTKQWNRRIFPIAFGREIGSDFLFIDCLMIAYLGYCFFWKKTIGLDDFAALLNGTHIILYALSVLFEQMAGRAGEYAGYIDGFFDFCEQNGEVSNDKNQESMAADSRTISEISMEHVDFGYGEKKVLQDICFRVKKGEKIDKLLFGGYSTISLGYAGLYECVKYMTGKSHTDAGAKPFALSVMQHMNDKCNAWKKAENIDYSLYGTPLESTTYKFAKCLQKRFGVIEGVTDKGYITNSYHVHVTEKIDAFTKLKFEAQFQHLSPGGAISYVEVPNMQQNLEAVLQVMKFIYDNIIYAELNTKSDYCQVCGWDGEIEVVEEDGKLIWKCPQCGNTDQDKMNVARRTCGYIGTQFWNQGRTQEIKDRVLHL